MSIIPETTGNAMAVQVANLRSRVSAQEAHTSGWVNVRSYGAKGDGTTDDTSALNAALSAVSSAQGKVYLGAGNYKITGPVVIPLGVSIEANGPTYGSVLYLSGASASLTFLGSGFGGGWSFRQYVRNVMIRHAPGSAAPTSGKLIEMVNAYNVEFHDVYVADVPSSTAAFDVTDCNDIILQNVVIRTENGSSSNYGLRAHGASTVKLINPDFEELYIGAQNLDSSTLDIVSPYMERNIVGVDNSAAGTGQVNLYGGYIIASNDSGWPVRSFVSGSITNIWGTRLANGGGTNTYYRAATAEGLFYDYALRRLQLGRPAAAGQAAPGYALTLNEAATQGTQYGLGLGQFVYHISSTFPDDPAIVWMGSGDKVFRLFGNGSTILSLYTDGAIQALQRISGGRVTPTYGTTVSISGFSGNEFVITPTDGVGFAIGAPTSPLAGQRISIRIRNTTGGALGTVTWNAAYKLASWTNPATGFSRTIDFQCDGTNWIETSRTPADVPN